MIDWNKFKNGKLSVILRTKELAEDFYKKCKERGIDWNGILIMQFGEREELNIRMTHSLIC